MLASPYVKSVIPAAIVGGGVYAVTEKPAYAAIGAAITYAISAYYMSRE
jgi:hypothetical protein